MLHFIYSSATTLTLTMKADISDEECLTIARIIFFYNEFNTTVYDWAFQKRVFPLTWNTFTIIQISISLCSRCSVCLMLTDEVKNRATPTGGSQQNVRIQECCYICVTAGTHLWVSCYGQRQIPKSVQQVHSMPVVIQEPDIELSVKLLSLDSYREQQPVWLYLQRDRVATICLGEQFTSNTCPKTESCVSVERHGCEQSDVWRTIEETLTLLGTGGALSMKK